jgi:hypothetical protein
MNKHLWFRGFIVATSFFFPALAGTAAEAPKPLRLLLVTGGCCHDYAKQKDILKKGLEARANVTVDILYSDDTTTKPPLPILGNPDYANGYDLVIHDECAADVSDPKMVEAVLKPHRDGLPGVNLHCAMHSYRIGNPTIPSPSARRMDIGLNISACNPASTRAKAHRHHFHGQGKPHCQRVGDWTTIHEEHYNNVHIFDTAHPLAHGTCRSCSRRREQSRPTILSSSGPMNTAPRKPAFSAPPSATTTRRCPTRATWILSRAASCGPRTLNDDGTPAKATAPKGSEDYALGWADSAGGRGRSGQTFAAILAGRTRQTGAPFTC